MKKFSLIRLIITAIAASGVFAASEAGAALGDLYVGDAGFKLIHKCTPNGTQSTFATGLQDYPGYLAFDKAGNLYVPDLAGSTNRTITKITPAGAKSTFANDIDVEGLAFDSADNLFASDFANAAIVKFTPAGAKSTFATSINVVDLIFDRAGNLYAADFGAPASNPGGIGVDGQGKIYKFTPDGTKTTYASGLNRPKRFAFDYSGNLYVGNTDGIILKFAPNGTKTTFATGLGNIQGLACDAPGNVYASSAPYIVKITQSGTKTNFTSINNPAGLAFERPTGTCLNIATRLAVQTGDNALIAGFIITGPDHKLVLVRGMGPSLAKFGVTGALQDPIIEMHFPNGSVSSNDNWKTGNAAANIQGTAFAPTDDRESALEYDLPPGNYTVIERGVGNTTGVGLVEVYDILQSQNSRLANISTRGFVGGADNVMIGGFILGANGARVIVRAIGPSLTQAGIAGALSDTKLSLRNGNGTEIAANDDWQDTQKAEIQATGVPPSNSLESAIVATLPNGNYTAIVSGYQGATGVGLVEVYNLQ